VLHQVLIFHQESDHNIWGRLLSASMILFTTANGKIELLCQRITQLMYQKYSQPPRQWEGIPIPAAPIAFAYFSCSHY